MTDQWYPYNINHPQLSRYNLIKIISPPDGNCFFHSVMRGATADYIAHPSLRYQFSNGLRCRLGEYLFKVEDNGLTVYENLSCGQFRYFAEEVAGDTSEFKLENLYATLNSTAFVGLEVLELCSKFLDLNIIIWDHLKNDIYRHGAKDLLYKPERSSVVIIYCPLGDDAPVSNHFDLMGMYNYQTKEMLTHFTHQNPFIQTLLKIW